MAARLAYRVHIVDEDGENHVFGPDDNVPAWAQKAITNPSAWEGDTLPHAERTDGVPPKGGPGSGKDAWAAYAASKNVEVAADATRDEIVAALEAAGVPTE